MRNLIKTKSDITFLNMNGIDTDLGTISLGTKLLSRFSRGILYGSKEGLSKYNKEFLIRLKDSTFKLYKVNLAISLTMSLVRDRIDSEDVKVSFSVFNILNGICKSSMTLLRINKDYIDALYKYKVKDQIIYDAFMNNFEYLEERTRSLGVILVEYLPMVGLSGYNKFLESSGTSFIEDVYETLESFLEKCPKFYSIGFPNSGGENGELYGERREIYESHLKEMFRSNNIQEEDTTAAIKNWSERLNVKKVNTFKTIKALRVDLTNEYKEIVDKSIRDVQERFTEMQQDIQYHIDVKYYIGSAVRRFLFSKLKTMGGTGILLAEVRLSKNSKKGYILKYVEKIENDEPFLGDSLIRATILDSSKLEYVQELVDKYNNSITDEKPESQRRLFYHEFKISGMT